MDLRLTEDELAFRAEVRAFVRRAAVFGLTFHPRMLEWFAEEEGGASMADVPQRLGDLFEALLPALSTEPVQGVITERDDDARVSRRRKAAAAEIKPMPEPDSPADALDRITIPADAMARISVISVKTG